MYCIIALNRSHEEEIIMEKKSGGCFAGGIAVIIIGVLLYFSLTMTISSISGMYRDSKLRESGVYIYGYCEYSHTKKHVNDDDHTGHSSVTYTYSMDVTYSYGGQVYTKHKVSTSKRYQQGETVKICVLPENPNIMCEHFGSTSGYIVTLILGLTFLTLTVGIPLISITSNMSGRHKEIKPTNYREPATPGDGHFQDYPSGRTDDYEIFNSSGRRPYGSSVGSNFTEPPRSDYPSVQGQTYSPSDDPEIFHSFDRRRY